MVFTCMSIAAESVRRIIEMERERAAAAAAAAACGSEELSEVAWQCRNTMRDLFIGDNKESIKLRSSSCFL